MEAESDAARPSSLTRLGLVHKEIVLEFGGTPASVPDDGVAALEASVRWVEEALNTGMDVSRTAELQVMVAVQLAPKSAVDWNLFDPPRFRLVQDHLVAIHGFDRDACEALARKVAVLLDDLQTARGGLSTTADYLMERDGAFCRACRLRFRPDGAECVRRKDPYKPHFERPELYTKAEIDHILPIALQGTHCEKNLQLLCHACNQAKSDVLRIDPTAEIRFAASPVKEIDTSHRFKMLYWKIARGGGLCDGCGTDEKELTVRLRHPDATYSRPNLVLSCYGCIDKWAE